MLTSQQLATLKTHIEADPVLMAFPHNADGAFPVADAMNVVVTPAYILWKSSVALDEIMRNGMDWTLVDNLNVGKARIWEWLGNLGTINPSKPNVRAGIDAAWAGTGAAFVAIRAAIYVHCKRSATRAEKLFASGSGTDALPSTSAFDQPLVLTYNDIRDAMGW